MTFLTFTSLATCGMCGRRLGGFTLGTYRVNKSSFVLTGKSPGLGWHEDPCRECGHHNGYPVSEKWRLEPESLAAVNAVRVKRGWEPLAR